MFASRQRSKPRFPKWLVSGSVIALCLTAWSGPASAYRPFDGTDAAVAAPGEVEIELQPAGRLRENGNTTLVAPATVINYGLSEGWEAVFEGQGQTPLSPSGPTSLTAAGAFLKHVLQPGSLQDKTGPSVATEFGVLLPDSTGNSGVGASLAGIISQRWDSGTIHLNTETALTRDHHGDVFIGGIIEGPSKWSIRPVAEFFYEKEFGKLETISGLIGLSRYRRGRLPLSRYRRRRFPLSRYWERWISRWKLRSHRFPRRRFPPRVPPPRARICVRCICTRTRLPVRLLRRL